jgi:hypothetical protein
MYTFNTIGSIEYNFILLNFIDMVLDIINSIRINI